MTMVDRPGHGASAPSPSHPQSAARRLQTSFAAVRVSFTWLGVRKTLTPGQKAQAAESFGAEEKYLSAAKKLLDTSNPLFRDVTAVRNRILSYWKGMTLPYPEPGLRLIKQDQVDPFDQQVRSLQEELDHAVQRLDEHYDALKDAARQRLGTLFNDADYPPTLVGLFQVEWEYPSVEPPEYLMRLSPQLFEAEKQRITARFDEAVRLAESAFTAEFGQLVNHLTERISGTGPDSQKKVFRDSAITNLQEFFSRFKSLNVHSNAQLDELVETAQKAVQGITAQDLRDQDSLRKQVNAQMAGVLSTLDGLLVDQPRRKILRPTLQPRQVA